jgi:adenosylcobinamide-GDP ribazoletransferase
MNSFFLAWKFLTILPGWGGKGAIDPQRLGPSMAYYPLVGFFLGLILWIFFWFLTWMFPRNLADGLLLFLLVVLTGALHLDGLADTLDGLAHGRSAEERLQIMKDHQVGAFGVIGLILILGIKFLALNSLPKQIAIKGLLLAVTLGRFSMVQLLYGSPYARKNGGLGLSFKEQLGKKEMILSAIFALAISFFLLRGGGFILWGAVCLSTFLLGKFFTRKIGGVTGDILGAGNEINETLILIMVAGMNQWAGDN